MRSTANSALQRWGVYFKEGVEKRAADRFEAKLYPTSLLGAIPRMIEGAQLGTIELITIPPAFFTVGKAVLKDKPRVLGMYQTMKAAAERTRQR
jgi:hypothetical protein